MGARRIKVGEYPVLFDSTYASTRLTVRHWGLFLRPIPVSVAGNLYHMYEE